MADWHFTSLADRWPPEDRDRLLRANLAGGGFGGLAILAISALVNPTHDPLHPLLLLMLAMHGAAVVMVAPLRLSPHLRAATLGMLCTMWACVLLAYVGPVAAVALFLVFLMLLAGFIYGAKGLAGGFVLALLLWVLSAYLWVIRVLPLAGSHNSDPHSLSRWVQTLMSFTVGALMISGLVHVLLRRTARFFAEEAELKASLAAEQALRAEGEVVRLRAELARREAEQMLATLYKAAPIGLALVKDRRLVLVNQWIATLLGTEAAALAGRSTRELYASDEEYERVGAICDEAFRAGRVAEAEVRLHTAARGECWVFLTAAPLELDGESPGIVVTVSDITVMKRAAEAVRQSEARLAEMFDHSSDLIFSVAVAGARFRIERVNRAVALYGLDPDAINGGASHLDEFLTREDAARTGRHFRRALAGGVPLTRSGLVTMPSGRVKFSTLLVPVLDPVSRVPRRLIGFARDITHHDRMEELRRAKLAADAASAAKSIFLSKMSHEIRTPLNAVLGFTRLLLRDDRLDERQRSYLETVDRNGEHLLGLVNDILEISKIEAAKVVFRLGDCSVRVLLDYLRTTFQPAAQAKGLRFTTACAETVPPILSVDEAKLRQILLNLIGNAIKFTAAGAVTVDARWEAGRNLVVQVADTGAGLSAEDQARLFQQFEQTEEGHRAGGTGLGLTISRGYARLMGGDVAVQSVPGRGATFTVTLPCHEPQQGEMTPRRPARGRPRFRLARGAAPVRLLVVDDVSDNRLLLTSLLREVGCDVREATNGREAVQALQVWQPHAALVDLKMPELDGIGATRLMRESFPSVRLKILGMSASVFSGESEQFHAAGADAFLAKPVRDDEILETLGRLLGVHFEEEEPAQAVAAPGPDGGRFDGLVAAVEEGDYATIVERLGELEAVDPVLAAKVRCDLQQFDYAAILRRVAAKEGA